MHQSKTRIRLRIRTQKVQVGICANGRLRSDCASAHKRFKSAYAPMEDSDQTAHPSKKVTNRHMHPSNSQIRLRIRAAKVKSGICAHRRLRSDCASAHTSYWLAFASIEDSDLTAHPRTKVKKVGICAHRRLRSDCASAQQKLQVGICAHRRLRSDCTSAQQKIKVGICANRTLKSDCTSAQQKIKVGICANRSLGSDCASAHKSYVGIYAIDNSDQTAHPRTKGTSQHIRQSKTQTRLRICQAKFTSRHMRQSKTQIKMHIRAAK